MLMRPSYVLGGQNMIVAYNKADIIEYMGVITEHVDMDHPVLLDKYIMGTECEVDAICDGENFLIPGIMEQVERTGVHSGDSICVYPAQHLTQAEIDTMVDYTGRFARELHVTGLVNVQYAIKGETVYVIETEQGNSEVDLYYSPDGILVKTVLDAGGKDGYVDFIPSQPSSSVDAYVKEHYMEKISLRSLGEMFYINNVYLGQLYKKRYHIVFRDYLNQLRLEKAKELLEDTDTRIYRIAEETGFGKADYFINKFVQVYRITPNQYRMKFKKSGRGN